MRLIAQGAEAKIHSDGSTVKKERFEKTYRHPELDKKLRGFRTRREAKILTKLQTAKFPAPRLVEMDDDRMEINMEHVPGQQVKHAIDDLEKAKKEKDYLTLCKEIGKDVAQLHNMGIIHQDLTTSNMILHEEEKRIYLIDFGLSFFSEKLEDKAVDLHLLKHALESRHHRIWEKCFKAVTDSYVKEADKGEDILKRLMLVEKRGRYKSKH